MSQATIPGQIVYEVNVEVDVALAQAYRGWMDTYVREMVSLPGFLGAHIHNVLVPAPPAGMHAMCVQFVLRDTASLDLYLREHAMRFRVSSHQHFGDRARITRRVMRYTNSLTPDP
ncbi:uncharacterized protein DUF4286 [Luteimonas cucumeris]|uniref:Uncharacterized protein DUF4286 n=1 Tax=Luteimonas cucumeris TaxID=985012 RepID=A0A562L1W0_9GAMM|nr:DUF4286 family protein [Luteimonas cucumeris]TWI01650.1 uncharacterized protein DUF4286 [Luteimonas cucumeris]